METIVVKVADMASATFIKKVLEEFKSVIDVEIAKDNYLNAVQESTDQPENPIKKVKTAPEDYVSFEESLEALKKAGKL